MIAHSQFNTKGISANLGNETSTNASMDERVKWKVPRVRHLLLGASRVWQYEDDAPITLPGAAKLQSHAAPP